MGWINHESVIQAIERGLLPVPDAAKDYRLVVHHTRCSRCGQANRIVNQCGCDPENLPTRVPYPAIRTDEALLVWLSVRYPARNGMAEGSFLAFHHETNGELISVSYGRLSDEEKSHPVIVRDLVRTEDRLSDGRKVRVDWISPLNRARYYIITVEPPVPVVSADDWESIVPY